MKVLKIEPNKKPEVKDILEGLMPTVTKKITELFSYSGK